MGKVRIMKCNHCGRELSNSDFTTNHRTCKKCEAEKEKRYRTNRILADSFDSYYGGYVVVILNHVRDKEYRYTIKGTNGFMIQTNDIDYFKKKMDEICQEPKLVK